MELWKNYLAIINQQLSNIDTPAGTKNGNGTYSTTKNAYFNMTVWSVCARACVLEEGGPVAMCDELHGGTSTLQTVRIKERFEMYRSRETISGTYCTY